MAKKQRLILRSLARAQAGIYSSWAECFAQLNGFSGSSHRAFDTRELAEEAFRSTRADFLYAVDAACSGNPGPLEYRCVHIATGRENFKQGPFENRTNNIGEFLAIVHALALFKQRGLAAAQRLADDGWAAASRQPVPPPLGECGFERSHVEVAEDAVQLSNCDC